MPKGPIIGYAFAVDNSTFGIKAVGFPHEILEESAHHGLRFVDLAEHRATGIRSPRVYKEEPDISFQGGPHAESVLFLLDALRDKDFAEAGSILDREAEFFRGTDEAVGIPLLTVVDMDLLEAVTFLARRKIGLNSKTQLGMTALHWAAVFGKVEIVRILLEAGADSHQLNWSYLTPGELAVLNGQEEVRRVIEKHTGERAHEISVPQVLGRMREVRFPE